MKKISKKGTKCDFLTVNRVLLGLIMLIAGVLAAFGSNILILGNPGDFVGLIFIIAAIGSGLAILAKWEVEKVTWAPIIIFLLATFTVYRGDVTLMLISLTLVSNYILLMCNYKK